MCYTADAGAIPKAVRREVVSWVWGGQWGAPCGSWVPCCSLHHWAEPQGGCTRSQTSVVVSESLAPDAQLGGQNRVHLTDAGQRGSWEAGGEVRGMDGRGLTSGTHRVADQSKGGGDCNSFI